MSNILSRLKMHITEGNGFAGVQRYGINTSWIFLQKAAALLVSFFVGVYIARYLGPKDYGLLNYAISFVGIFSAVSTLGSDEILRRELVKGTEKKEALISTCFWIKLVGSILTILCLIFVSMFVVSGALVRLLIFIYAFTFLFQALNIFDIFFQSQVQSKRSAYVFIAATFASALLKIFGIAMHAGVVYFVAVYLCESIFIAMGLWFSYSLFYSSLNFGKFDRRIAREILMSSWPLMLSGIAITTYMRIDQVIIGNMLGVTSVGVYAIAAKLSEVWYILPAVICSSLFPALVHIRTKDPALYAKRLMKLYFMMFWLAVLIAFPISLFARPIILMLFGTAYLGATHVLQIYVWAGVAVFVGSALAQYLTIENFTKIYFVTTLIGGILNISLNVLLIPRFGIVGSAWATVISYSSVIVSIVFFQKTIQHARLMLRGIFQL